MNEAFVAPFLIAFMAAIQDAGVTRNENLLALVGANIFPERPKGDVSDFVVIDYPFGGRGPAYVHGENGDAVAHWVRLQASTWASKKLASLNILDALIQAIDGRDICVSDSWGTVRLFMRGSPWNQVDEIAEVLRYGAGARYEILMC